MGKTLARSDQVTNTKKHWATQWHMGAGVPAKAQGHPEDTTSVGISRDSLPTSENILCAKRPIRPWGHRVNPASSSGVFVGGASDLSECQTCYVVRNKKPSFLFFFYLCDIAWPSCLILVLLCFFSLGDTILAPSLLFFAYHANCF